MAPIGARAADCGDEFGGKPSLTDVSGLVDLVLAAFKNTLGYDPSAPARNIAAPIEFRAYDLDGLNEILSSRFGEFTGRTPVSTVDRDEAVLAEDKVLRDADRLIDDMLTTWRMTDESSAELLRLYGGPFPVQDDYESERALRAAILAKDEAYRIERIRQELLRIQREPPLVVAFANHRLAFRTDVPAALRDDLGDCYVGQYKSFAEYVRIPSVARRSRTWSVRRK